jgi:leader peptidase (prepilin peptidase)/N-methyltransferase
LDLFPVASFLWLRGRCRYCRASISWRYPLVELLTGVLTLLAWLRFGATVELAAVLFLTYVLIAIAFIDLDHQLIPNALTYPAIVIGLVLRFWQGAWLEAVSGGLVGGGILLFVAWLYPKGMGMGDVKFLAMAGVFLGWLKALYVLFVGSFLGVLVILPLMLMKKIGRGQPFPFGPFLVAATLVMVYAGDWVVGIFAG